MAETEKIIVETFPSAPAVLLPITLTFGEL